MADWTQAAKITVEHEGGYENNPNDSGNWYNGLNYGTKYGITARDVAIYFPDRLSDPNCIQNLSVSDAMKIYYWGYWKSLYSQIDDQSIANKLFDLGVLFGVKEAVKKLQFALGLTNIDGDFGNETLNKLNESYAPTILVGFKQAMCELADEIGEKEQHDKEFVNGWKNRINS